jgi:lipopolysaccharide/colanic/teichoic acid biosynthesis glycosyltransferase
LTIYIPNQESSVESPEQISQGVKESKIAGSLDRAISPENYILDLPLPRYPQSPLFSFVESFISTVGLLTLSPLLAAVALLIKIDDSGPIFFRQERLGKDGKLFKIFKFRTMRTDAEKNGPFICESYEDNRITGLGKFLRKSKLDELPQLINVILGEMSLIGPRPERPHFHSKNQWIPNWNRRLDVKPGITGLAQISKYISHNPEQKIHADLFYSSNRSLKSDIILLVMTVIPWLKKDKFFGIRLK